MTAAEWARVFLGDGRAQFPRKRPVGLSEPAWAEACGMREEIAACMSVKGEVYKLKLDRETVAALHRLKAEMGLRSVSQVIYRLVERYHGTWRF